MLRRIVNYYFLDKIWNIIYLLLSGLTFKNQTICYDVMYVHDAFQVFVSGLMRNQ